MNNRQPDGAGFAATSKFAHAHVLNDGSNSKTTTSHDMNPGTPRQRETSWQADQVGQGKMQTSSTHGLIPGDWEATRTRGGGYDTLRLTVSRPGDLCLTRRHRHCQLCSARSYAISVPITCTGKVFRCFLRPMSWKLGNIQGRRLEIARHPFCVNREWGLPTHIARIDFDTTTFQSPIM